MMMSTELEVQQPHRLIHLNDPIKNKASRFLHNGITTGKYNAFTFIFKFLFEQFSKYANLFFLFIGSIQVSTSYKCYHSLLNIQYNYALIMLTQSFHDFLNNHFIQQQISDWSPTNKYGTVAPLALILLVTAAKEILEDMQRHAQDKQTNNRIVQVLSGDKFYPKKWIELVVGDLVRVENSHYFPADLILLSSSEPDALCYIETANLDGETNLKIRQGLPETANILSPEELSRLVGINKSAVKTELPNNSLYTFEGTLRLKEKEISLNPDQMLLRGAMLRNTRWIYGLVIFTGHESKLMKNATATPIKKTSLENLVNQHIAFLFIVLVATSVICALGSLHRQLTNTFESTIMKADPNMAWIMFPQNIMTYIILYNNLIPMSLIVTMEIVRFFIGSLINSDEDLYYEVNDTPATARTSSLVDQLGQVDYIFSDKTGTLTCNMMDFKMVTIGGLAYAEEVPDNRKAYTDDQGRPQGWHDFKKLKDHENNPNYSHSWAIKEFLQLLAVCHTVIPEESEEEPGKITYQASSPDEGALVKGAKTLGYEFRIRRPRSVSYVMNGKEYEWEVLQVNEFNSTRKRMSALVRSPEGQIKLYIKGADTVIFDRLSKLENPYLDQTVNLLEEYANEGLRTLCIAYRDVSVEEYYEWAKVYEKAANTINNRGDELMKAAELIEKDLFLLGATAIEDKLQDEVPDTIHTLATAGIRIWVLTGDRQETAINIGYSCKLITEEMSLIIVNEPTHFQTKEFLEARLQQVKGNSENPQDNFLTRYVKGVPYINMLKKKKKLPKCSMDSLENIALIIDGKSLDYALEDDIKMIFLELAVYCKAVICCRVSPLQKALVVNLVRKNVEEAVTLAIGDGANDVSMIQAAHIGVGISGLEGLQAARSADFAIAQFRFLRKLLLVHGCWAYSRLSKVVLYSFYKNIVLNWLQFWFAFLNGFSGTTLYETWTGGAYNVALAVFQPIAIGCFDQFITARMLDRYPKLYKLGQSGEFYNTWTFFYWFMNSMFQSILMFFLFALLFGEGSLMPDGNTMNVWAMGEILYTISLITIGIKAALIADTWVKFTFYAIIGSLALWFLFFPFYVAVGPAVGLGTELFGMNQPIFGSASFYFIIFIIPIATNLRDYAWKYFKRMVWPRDYHIIQEMVKYNIPDARPRADLFKKQVQKVRLTQRIKRQRGFAFSQNEDGQAHLIRIYDTTRRKPKG